MKQLIKIIAIICTLIVAVLVALSIYGYIEYRSTASKIEGQTQGIANEAVTAITKAWDPQQLETRAHPLLIQMVKKQGQTISNFFSIYNKLGPVRSAAECKLANFRSNIGVPTFTLADYVCAMDFQNAGGTIYMELLKDKDSKDTFLITAFKIDSPLFTNMLMKK